MKGVELNGHFPGVLADDKLSLAVVAWHPGGVDVVSPRHWRGESDSGEVHGHVVQAVVVQVVAGVGGSQILMAGGLNSSGRTELLLQRLPAGEGLPDLAPVLAPVLHASHKLKQILFSDQRVASRNGLHQNLS